MHYDKTKRSESFWSRVGNKANGQMSKWVFQENKTGQIFRKTNISYLLIRTLVGSLRWPNWGLMSTLCFQSILDQKTLLNNVV